MVDHVWPGSPSGPRDVKLSTIKESVVDVDWGNEDNVLANQVAHSALTLMQW